MDEGRNMVLVFPTLVRFGGEEERRRFYPSCHIFYERRCMDVSTSGGIRKRRLMVVGA